MIAKVLSARVAIRTPLLMRLCLAASLLLYRGPALAWDGPPDSREPADAGAGSSLSLAVGRALQAQDLVAAHRLLLDSYRRKPSPEVLYFLGRLAAAEGRAVAAHDFLQRYQEESTDEPAERLAEARRLTESRPRGGAELTIIGPAGGLVFLGDRLLGTLPFRRPLLAAAGDFAIRLEYKQRTMSDRLRIMEGRAAGVRFDLESELAIVSQGPAIALLLDLDAAPKLEASRLLAAVQAGAALRRWAALVPTGMNIPSGAACSQNRECIKNVAAALEVEHVLLLRATGPAALSLSLHDTIASAPVAARQLSCRGCDSETLSGLLSTLSAELLAETIQRGRATLAIASQPEGAALQLDGHDSGTAPQRKVVVGGSHEVEARLPGYQVVRRSVTLQPGQSLDIVLDLPPGAPSVRRGSSPGKPLAIVGGLGLGVSGLLLGLGAGLVSIDGSCAPVGTTTCDTVHRSLAAGVTLIVGGVATGIASGVLLYRSR